MNAQELGRHVGPRPFLHERYEQLAGLRFERVRPERVGPTLGAVLHGVDLSKPLDAATVAELERAFLEFKVIFFRDQNLTTAQHVAFAERFGELEEHPFLPAKDGHAELVRFEKGPDVAGYENLWHSDVSWRRIPSLGSVLRAIEVPDVGGDTLWADMEAAYEGLADELKQRIEGLVAVHDFSQSFGALLEPEERARQQAKFPPARHPVVRRHPVTGRRSIYVNSIFTSHIEGLPGPESDALLAELCDQARHPEYQCRFQWRADSVAFWDNRCVQHYAVNDYFPRRRVMERATIVGDAPR